mmetsp:Transcript_28882/g.66756  ORF Transcript_28882/g.66756 Transcript_28882/m.66756 type:complete len:93 (-) Transcript_28882:1281-1559(-)
MELGRPLSADIGRPLSADDVLEPPGRARSTELLREPDGVISLRPTLSFSTEDDLEPRPLTPLLSADEGREPGPTRGDGVRDRAPIDDVLLRT